MKIEGYRRKTTFEKKIGSRSGLPRSPGSWVDPPVRPGLAESLHRPVFWQTRTGPATRLTRRAGSGLITMVFFIYSVSCLMT